MENKDTVNVGRPTDDTKKVKKTNAPKKARVPKGEKYEPRVAKLSGRTHKGLIRLIKEDRIAYAFDKYNESYIKMQAALKKANKIAKDDSKSQAEVDFEYKVAAAYASKMAKYGAKVTKHDLRLNKALGRDSKKPRKIKVPNFLVRNLTKVMRFFNRVTGSAREFISDKTYAASDAIFRKTQRQLKNDFEKQLQSAIASARETGKIGDEVKRFNLNDLELEEGREELKNIVLNKPSTTSQADELKDKDTKTGGNNVPPAKPTSSITTDGLNALFTSGKGKAEKTDDENTEKTDENKTTTSDVVVEPKKEELKTEGTDAVSDKNEGPVKDSETPVSTEKKPVTTLNSEVAERRKIKGDIDRYYKKALEAKTHEERAKYVALWNKANEALVQHDNHVMQHAPLQEVKKEEVVTSEKKEAVVSPSATPVTEKKVEVDIPAAPSVADMKALDAELFSKTAELEKLVAMKQQILDEANATIEKIKGEMSVPPKQK